MNSSSLSSIVLNEASIDLFHLRPDYEEVVLGYVEKNPIVLLKPKKIRKEKRMLIAALVHGDETSGFNAILDLVNDGFDDPKVDISYLPLVNPAGFIQGTREDHKELNPNRGYAHDLDPVSPEGKVLLKNIKILNALSKDFFLTLHEDSREDKFYMYSYEHSTKPGEISKEVLKIGKRHFKKIFDIGIFMNDHDGSLEDRMFDDGSKISMTTEMPGKWGVDKRIEATLEIIKKIVKMI